MRAWVAALLVLSTLASATPRPARDTADVGNRGAWSVGLFNPLKLAFSDRVEVQAHPLLFFVAPHLDLRLAVLKPEVRQGELPRGFRLTVEGGLLLPTLAMRLTKGLLFPTWSTSTNDIGWMLIPHVGLLLTKDFFVADAFTVRLDGQFRIPIGPNSAAPLNSFLVPLDLLFAAPLTGFLGRGGLAYDHAFGDLFRLRGEVNLFITGTQGSLIVSGQDVGPIAGIDPFIVTAQLSLDIAVFEKARVMVGVYFANMDQGGTALTTGPDGFSERARVRSTNVLPTVDFIWSGF